MNITTAEIRALIHKVTRRTGTPVHDEDLEQDVALHALEAFRRLNEVTHPRALLMKIVCDTVHDHWRRRRSCEGLDGVDERFISHLPELDSAIDRDRQAGMIYRALGQLPATKRAILEFFYIQDLSIAEIAALQGRSVSAVKMELARSRHSLARIVRNIADNKSR